MQKWDVKIRLETDHCLTREQLLDLFQKLLEDTKGISEYSFSVKRPPIPPEPDDLKYYRMKKRE